MLTAWNTLAITGVVACGAIVVLVVWPSPSRAPSLMWTVDRGDLLADLIEPGTLRAAQSITYRSPVNGRQLEIVQLVPEGVRVGIGEVIARLETRDLEADLQQGMESVHEAEFARQVAELDLLEATAELQSTVDGEGPLTIEESRTNLQLTEKKVDRLRQEVENLQPLLDKGYITGDELERSQAELETAEADLAIARRRASVLVDQIQPVTRRRAELQLAQAQAQQEAVERRIAAARRRLAAIGDLIERCTIRAASPGLVVHEEFMASSPRRKVRLGDQVTPSQGIVRVVEVSRMLVDTSVPERFIHRVRAGRPVTVRLEAFPDLQLAGQITGVGALARTTRDQWVESKRFDVIVTLDPTEVELRPEMTARVDIRVGERQDVLRLPVTAVFERDGLTMVNVLRGSRTVAQRIEIGEQTPQFVEVVAGVTEGQRVMLVGEPTGNGLTAATGESGGPGDSLAVLGANASSLSDAAR